jgi:hypothetical protein
MIVNDFLVMSRTSECHSGPAFILSPQQTRLKADDAAEALVSSSFVRLPRWLHPVATRVVGDNFAAMEDQRMGRTTRVMMEVG